MKKGTPQRPASPLGWTKVFLATVATLVLAVVLGWICVQAERDNRSRGDWNKISTIIAEKRK